MTTTSDNPPQDVMDTKPAVRVAWGFLFQVYCAKDGATDAEIVRIANLTEPAGTSNGTWSVCTLDQLITWGDIADEVRRCPDYPNRHHVVVAC